MKGIRITSSIQTQAASKHTGAVHTYEGIQTYRGTSKTYSGCPHIWGIWTPLSVTKHAFFVLCIYRGIQTYGVIQMWGASKHMGVYTHIQGASKHRGVPVYTQHKESMLCQTKGVSIYPIHLDAPICLDTPMFECPLYDGIPPYAWMPPYVWMAPWMFGCPCMSGCPLYLDAPCMLGQPHMFRCPHIFG